MTLNRREFLTHLGFGIGAAALPCAAFSRLDVDIVDDPLKGYPYRAWEDLYRREWRWDRVGWGCHSVGCVAGCSWKVYSKNGIPLREEQTATYPSYAKGDRGEPVPDFSPRGCQKGIVYTDWMQQADFLKYPLKRAGERGERKWKRVSWDQAFDEIAEKIVEITLKEPGAAFLASRPFSFLSKGPSERLMGLLGGQAMAVSAMVGDLYPGAHTVRVPGRTVSTFDDWFTSDLILSWTKNIVPLRMPDAHFLTEARYNGARFISVDVVYSQTSTKADLYVPVRMGTDSHLAAALCNEVIRRKLYKVDYVKIHTDLPLLVRLDTKKFLTAKDMKPDGKAMQYYVWDTKTGRAVEAPGCADSPEDKKTLDLGVIDPALEGTFRVPVADGKEVECTTVFELTKKGLEPYTPKSIQATTGLHPSVTERMLEWIAESKRMRIIVGYNPQKHFDGYQLNRLQLLLLCLTGHHGVGGGMDTTYEGWKIDGFRMAGGLSKPDQGDVPGLGVKAAKGGKGPHSVGLPFEIVYGEMLGRSLAYYDQRELKERVGFDVGDMKTYLEDALKKGYQPSMRPPRISFWHSCNYYRSKVGQQDFRKHYLPKVELLVGVDIRMASSMQDCDYVLPAATDYERWDARETSVTPFIHLFGRPVRPMFERKSDWQIYVGLAKAIQRKARERGMKSIPLTQWNGKKEVRRTIDLQTIYDEFTLNGKIAEDEKALEWVFEVTKALGKARYEECVKNGYVKLGPEAGKAGPLPADRPYRPFVEQVANKKPSKTNTGRFQFYLDHEYHLKLGMMTAKPQHGGGDLGPKRSKAGKAYPFVMDYPHTRWGIHSSYRANQWMLRHQRGEVYCYLNPRVMRERGIDDADKVRVFNDHGEWFATAKASTMIPPYIVYNEHGWEHYMSDNWTHYNNLNAEFLNPLELAGKYGHVCYLGGNHASNRIYYETRVDIEKVR